MRRYEGPIEGLLTVKGSGTIDPRIVRNARCEFEQAWLYLFGYDFDHCRNASFVAVNDAHNQSTLIPDRYYVPLGRQTEGPLHGMRSKRREIELRQVDLFFNCFLPNLENLAASFQSFNLFDIPCCYRREFTCWVQQFSNGARHHAQESNLHRAASVFVPQRQALRLHRTGIRAALHFAVSTRVDNAKIKSLPVFYGRRP